MSIDVMMPKVDGIKALKAIRNIEYVRAIRTGSIYERSWGLVEIEKLLP